jgi:hypothetical protein
MHCHAGFPSRGTRTFALVAAAITVLTSPLHAQVKVVGVISDQRMPDSAQQVAALAAGMRMRAPAAFALSMKQEIGLTPEQVAAVEALVPIEADSQRVRMRRMLERNQERARERPGAVVATAQAMMSWTDPIDEAAIRASACEQSQAQSDLMIGMMRDRRALGVLLTPMQRHELDRLQGELMTRAFRSAAPNK